MDPKKNSETGKRIKEKSPKWNAQIKMAESTDISVIKIIEIDYIKGADNHIGF